MAISPKNKPGKVGEDYQRLYIDLKYSKLSEKDWNLLQSAFAKGAKDEDRTAAVKILTKHKFLDYARPQRGPQRRTPQDEIRLLRQNYLWLLREILDDTDGNLSEKTVLDCSSSIIIFLNEECRNGLFLNSSTEWRLSEACKIHETEKIEENESRILHAIKFAMNTLIRYQWKNIVTESTKQVPGYENREMLEHAVFGQNAYSFRSLIPKRIRKSNAGRPRKIQHADNTNTIGFNESDAVTNFEKASVPDREFGPAPTEEEIFKKTVARLSFFKHTINSRKYLPFDNVLSEALSKLRVQSGLNVSKPIKEILDILWETGEQQIDVPWSRNESNEMAGYFDDIPPMGTWEVKI